MTTQNYRIVDTETNEAIVHYSKNGFLWGNITDQQSSSANFLEFPFEEAEAIVDYFNPGGRNGVVMEAL